MGRIVWTEFESVVIGSEGTLDVFSLMAASTNKLKVHGWEINSNSVTAVILALSLRKITTVGSGGATATEVLNDGDDGSITGSVRVDDTTEGTGVSGIQGYQWEQLGPLSQIYTPEMRPVIELSQGLALHLITATGFTMSGWICWEEI